jgi:hypothetical protein
MQAKRFDDPEREKTATVPLGKPRQVWALGESTNQPHAEIDNPDIVQVWFANDNNQVWVRGLRPGKATIKINYDLYNLNVGKHETHTGWLHIIVAEKDSDPKQGRDQRGLSSFGVQPNSRALDHGAEKLYPTLGRIRPVRDVLF